MEKDNLGNRMKSFYEGRNQTYLTRRVPVIIRVDGKNFSRFCKRFAKPYDIFLNKSLNFVMEYLCENVQGCKFAERHSDEISLLVTDFDDIKTDAYFDYNVQKICSVVASMATAEFCRILIDNSISYSDMIIDNDAELKNHLHLDEDWPNFDTRCFNIPESDVTNYFWWRNMDATRNSISMLAQSKFSHKELIKVNNNQKQEMLFQKYGINWNNLPQEQKTGHVCYKNTIVKTKENSNVNSVERRVWVTFPAPSKRDELDFLIEKAKSYDSKNV